MLCITCGNIILQPSKSGRRLLIRLYRNVSQLEKLSASCDFCALVFSELGDLLAADSFAYCRRLWGEDLYQKGLNTTPVEVYFVDHPKGCNITWRCKLEISSLEGYINGPTSGLSEGVFGGVFVDAESSNAHLIPGRPIETNPDCETMLRRTLSWFSHCKEKHNQCNAIRDGGSLLPRRILEVSTTANGRPALILVHPEPGSTGLYAALSYRWGNAPTLLLTDGSLREFTSQIRDLEDLSPTFRDSVLVTQHLGLRYLWIDALCIIQDSEMDWRDQSSRMSDIFSRANIVIRGANGSNTQHGLLNTSGRSSAYEAELKIASSSETSENCFIRPQLFKKEPLDSRCWAFQELRLAQRCITFGTSEMQWDCPQAHFSESGNPWVEARIPGFMIPVRYDLELTEDGLTNSSPFDTGSSVRVIWQYLVSQYCKRKLTLAKDKLPAIAGIARHFATQFMNLGTDQYLAGLWHSQLPFTLLWHIGHTTGVFASKPGTYRAPTWSWAYIDYDDINWVNSDPSDEAFATIQHVEISLLGEDGFGQVREAKLTVRGLVKRGLLLPDTFYGDYNEFWAEDAMQQFKERISGTRGARLGRISFDLGEPNEQKYVHCLRITSRAGLVIELCEDQRSSQIWRRIGVVEFSNNAIPWWQDCEHRIIVLI